MRCGKVEPGALDEAQLHALTTEAMRAFEPLSSVLRYREKDKWHTCDVMAMREVVKVIHAAGALKGLATAAETARATKSYDDNLQRSVGCATTGERIASAIEARAKEMSGGHDVDNG